MWFRDKLHAAFSPLRDALRPQLHPHVMCENVIDRLKIFFSRKEENELNANRTMRQCEILTGKLLFTNAHKVCGWVAARERP